jgi:hypothetical protein
MLAKREDMNWPLPPFRYPPQRRPALQPNRFVSQVRPHTTLHGRQQQALWTPLRKAAVRQRSFLSA